MNYIVCFLRCDLLKIYYLCGSNNSELLKARMAFAVVICLKFTTFVVATTVRYQQDRWQR